MAWRLRINGDLWNRFSAPDSTLSSSGAGDRRAGVSVRTPRKQGPHYQILESTELLRLEYELV
jgi:hypothetical protein